MAPKRPFDDAEITTVSSKKRRNGFTVGPADLPDGSYRRKAQKIKHGLIERAKVKAAYSNLKTREQQSQQAFNVPPSHQHEQKEGVPSETVHKPNTIDAASIDLHPSRQALITSAAGNESPDTSVLFAGAEETDQPKDRLQQRNSRRKHLLFFQKARQGEIEKEAAVMKRAGAETARIEREQKRRDRERWHKAIEKSKQPGPNGQMKLGRQSKVLLEKVKRSVGEEKLR